MQQFVLVSCVSRVKPFEQQSQHLSKVKPLGRVFVVHFVLTAQHLWQRKKDLCVRLASRMGSVRESSDAMASPKAAAPAVEGVQHLQ